MKKRFILLFCSNEQHTDYKLARAWDLKLPQIRRLTELKSGFREGLHLIKWGDEGKAIINVTHLGEASVGGGSNYKSPSGDLGVDEEEYEKHFARWRKFITCV